MSRNSSSLSYVLPTVAAVGAVVLCLVEWHSSRTQSERLTAQLLRSVRDSEKRSGEDSEKMQSFLRSVRRDLDKLTQQVSQASQAAKVAASKEEGAPATAKAEPADAAASEKEDLPPLPEGIDAVAVISNLNPAEFFDNPEYNPEKKVPSRPEIMAAINEVNAAKANMDMVNGEVQLAVVKALEDLKAGGHFTEYQKGQAPEAVEGVLSAAETTEDGGMRMFYFYPQDYPEIYQTKDKAKDIAESSFRRLLSMVNS